MLTITRVLSRKAVMLHITSPNTFSSDMWSTRYTGIEMHPIRKSERARDKMKKLELVRSLLSLRID